MTPTEHYELNRIEPSDLFDLSALNDNMDAIDAALYELSQRPSGEATLTTKTITQNATYTALSDNADGYSSVTVAVPLPTVTTQTAAADLTGYEPGDTDLGGGFTVTNDSGTIEVSSATVDGVTYDGLKIGGATTIKNLTNLSAGYNCVEFDMIITEFVSGDMRIISTGGYVFEMTVWASQSNGYIMYVLNGAQVLDEDLVRTVSSGNYYDPNLSKADTLNKRLIIKYIYANDYVILNVNGVDKAKWTMSTVTSTISTYGLNVGGNGVSTPTMLVTKAEYSGETLTYEGRSWTPVYGSDGG